MVSGTWYSIPPEPHTTRSGITNCQRCGKPIDKPRWNKRYCNATCQRNVSRATRENVFIGVDGEGVDRPNGDHEYVMLSVGEHTLFREGRVLSLSEILTFLWECFLNNPHAIYVGFFLGYDFTQWFKHLDQETARLLFTTQGVEERKTRRPGSRQRVPQPVVWNGWEIDVLAGRRVKLRKHQHKLSLFTGKCRIRSCGHEVDPTNPFSGEPMWDPLVDAGSLRTGEWLGSGPAFWKQFQPKESREWMYICDTGPFWQTSFLNAIDPKKWTEPVCTEEEYDIIVEGKADRGITVAHGDSGFFESMRRYNVLENAVLARVTARLDAGFRNKYIPIELAKSDWYGPGRAAQKWMDLLHGRMADDAAIRRNRERISTTDAGNPLENEYGIKNADVYMSMPAWFADAARASYYGGWFEIFMHGHIGNVWEYDINSAYPFIIATLPCLHTDNGHSGQYYMGKDGDPPDEPYTLLYGTIRGADPFIGAMPHRTRRGSILRPHVTKGWYWQHEIQAAQRAGLVDSVDIEEWVAYRPCTCTVPFNPTDIGIERMYNLRLQVGKNSPQGKGFKLVYNSAYGKTAQSIGQPKYSNPVYASLITAGCRTLILDAIASHPQGSRAVAMVATDGVYFTSSHPSLTLDANTLGAWDEQVKTGMTLFMPGVYWDDKTRDKIKVGDTPSLKSRGINAKDLADQIEQLDTLFAQLHADMVVSPPDDITWPSIKFKVRFLLESCKSALNRGDWGSAGRITHGASRVMSSTPESKRIQRPYLDPTNLIVRTSPYDIGPDGAETVPYPKMFGKPEPEEFFPGHIGRDGDDGMQYWRDMMKGL